MKPAQSSRCVGDRRGDRLIHFMGNGGRELSHRRYAVRMRQLDLHLTVAPVDFACFCFCPLALGDIAAHVPYVYGLPGFRIVDPKDRIEDRNGISGLEMAKTHLSRPGTLLQHRRPEDLSHELTVRGEYPVDTAPRPRFFPAVESDHFQPGLVQVDSRLSTEVGN